jgi:hypothetical protein
MPNAQESSEVKRVLVEDMIAETEAIRMFFLVITYRASYPAIVKIRKIIILTYKTAPQTLYAESALSISAHQPTPSA